MQRLEIEEFKRRAPAFDRAVVQTPDIDQFCSATPWVLSAFEAFSAEYDTWIRESEDGFVALVEGEHERLGRFRQPLEASWCLACPFVGERPRALAHEFARECMRDRSWDLLFLSGIQRDSTLYHSLVEAFSGSYFVGVGPPVSRYVASLAGGEEGYLSRRSSKFRANLRRLRRRADEDDISYEYLTSFGEDSWEDVYARILAVEEHSWKGKEGTGIIDDPMQSFYRYMLPRLVERDALRVLFVRQGDEDIAFVFGGVLGQTYRGLQLSYHDDYRDHSPGNLAQLAIISRLCDEDIDTYDLGSELDYKSRWAEERFETMSLVIRTW